MRVLFEEGSYMRKYGNYSSAVNNFLFFKSSHTFSLLIKTYELEIRNMTGTKYIVFTFDLPYDTEKLFLEFAPILCGGPVQFPARNHDIKMCVKVEIQCLCMDFESTEGIYLIFCCSFVFVPLHGQKADFCQIFELIQFLLYNLVTLLL